MATKQRGCDAKKLISLARLILRLNSSAPTHQPHAHEKPALRCRAQSW